MRPVVLLISLLLAATAAHAVVPDSEREFRAHLRTLQESGALGYEEALLLRFQRVFAPEDIPAALRSASPDPAKSVTLLLHEYTTIRDGLAPDVVGAIDDLLGNSAAASGSFETAHFRIAWTNSGPDAIPAEDLDASGVPDFVERVGAWSETAWTRFVDAGFVAPHLDAGRVNISFRGMSAYGFTQVVDGTPAIVLHRNFQGFPSNRDPDGSVFGAAKVTIAHELKHASQYATSGWTEGGWLEADATWAEDFVFDETDDYLHYLSYNSPVSAPAGWLPASYEDCLWQHSLEQVYGTELLVRFFERRADFPNEPVTQTFDRTLRAYGSSLARGLETLGIWSYFSGANAAGRPAGFSEADQYPTPPLRTYLADPGETSTDRVASMGTHLVLASRAGRVGRPELSFVGDRNATFSLNAVITLLSGNRSVFRVPMVSPSSSSAALPFEWESVASVLILATNLSDTANSQYSITFNDENSVGIAELAASAPLLEPNRPNPFSARTTITFSVPAVGPVRLVIFDVGGRLVRRLHDGNTMPVGRHETSWNGLDEAGRAASPGVYYYRLETVTGSATRRMLLLR